MSTSRRPTRSILGPPTCRLKYSSTGSGTSFLKTVARWCFMTSIERSLRTRTVSCRLGMCTRVRVGVAKTMNTNATQTMHKQQYIYIYATHLNMHTHITHIIEWHSIQWHRIERYTYMCGVRVRVCLSACVRAYVRQLWNIRTHTRMRAQYFTIVSYRHLFVHQICQYMPTLYSIERTRHSGCGEAPHCVDIVIYNVYCDPRSLHVSIVLLYKSH